MLYVGSISQDFKMHNQRNNFKQMFQLLGAVLDCVIFIELYD